MWKVHAKVLKLKSISGLLKYPQSDNSNLTCMTIEYLTKSKHWYLKWQCWLLCREKICRPTNFSNRRNNYWQKQKLISSYRDINMVVKIKLNYRYHIRKSQSFPRNRNIHQPLQDCKYERCEWKLCPLLATRAAPGVNIQGHSDNAFCSYPSKVHV